MKKSNCERVLKDSMWKSDAGEDSEDKEYQLKHKKKFAESIRAANEKAADSDDDWGNWVNSTGKPKHGKVEAKPKPKPKPENKDQTERREKWAKENAAKLKEFQSQRAERIWRNAAATENLSVSMDVDEAKNRPKRTRLVDMTKLSAWAEDIERDVDKMLDAQNQLAKRVSHQENEVKTLIKRVSISDARLAQLTKKDIVEQRRMLATHLTARGWWMEDRKKLAPPEWGDETLNWVFDRIGLDPLEVEREHFAKKRKMPREWTLLIFQI